VQACQGNYSALIAHDIGILQPNVDGTPPAGCDCFSALVVYDVTSMELVGYTFQVVEEAGYEDELQLTESNGCDLHYEVVAGELLGVGEHGGHDHDHEFTAVIGIAMVDTEDEPANCVTGTPDEAACGPFCTLAFSVVVDETAITLTPEAMVEGGELPGTNRCDCHELDGTGTIDGSGTVAAGTLENGDAFALAYNSANTLLELTIGASCTNAYTLLDGDLLGKTSAEGGRPVFEEGAGTHEHNASLLTLVHAEPEVCETAACVPECFAQLYGLAAHDLTLLQPVSGAMSGDSGCTCNAVLVVYDSTTQMALRVQHGAGPRRRAPAHGGRLRVPLQRVARRDPRRRPRRPRPRLRRRRRDHGGAVGGRRAARASAAGGGDRGPAARRRVIHLIERERLRD